MAEDSVAGVSDIGDIGVQNCLPGGGETESRVHTFLPRLPLFGGEVASIDDILLQYQSVFGPTETAQNILSRFYSLQQGQTEDAGDFAARLEDVIHQAVQLGRVRREDVDTMLCEAFEGGLRRETKAVTSYLFTPRKEFSKLLVEVKRKERELVNKEGTVASMQASEVDALKSQVLELRSELQTLKNEWAQQPSPYSPSAPHSASHPARSVPGP